MNWVNEHPPEDIGINSSPAFVNLTLSNNLSAFAQNSTFNKLNIGNQQQNLIMGKLKV